MNRWIIFILMMGFTIGATLSVQAQSLNFGSGDTPIEIDADNGIEWQQDGLIFVARGNARAIRGEVQVLADELRAYYRKTPKGGTEIWRLDAIGAVRIKSTEGTAYGDNAVYDVDNSMLIITGKNLKLVSGQDWLTATDQLEYWEKKQMAVARGNAVSKRENKKLGAKILVAYFRKNKTNKTRIYRVDAFEAVKVITGKDEATSDRGVYNVESGIASLKGNVKIVRENNVLKGCSADVNLNTGISQLHSCAKGNSRVKGRFLPKKKPRK
jgi:lipopolysaccharide export system protein LptA